MNIVPLKPLPSQIVSVVLAEQATTLRVYQKFFGLYIDVFVNDVLIIGGVVCRDRNRIVRSEYLDFIGDLAFFDTQHTHTGEDPHITEGISDPDYTGLGDRFLLAYFSDIEVNDLRFT